jgi:hypothetical protein
MVCEPNIGLLLPLRDDLRRRHHEDEDVRTHARKHVDDMEYV